MAKETEQQTMEEYLLSQLDTPVVLKDGTMMTKPDGDSHEHPEPCDEGRREGCPVHPEHSDEGEDHEEEVNPRRYCARIVDNIMFHN